ncbi:MAG: nucleotidyltransferase family protein [Halioglobus sp.]
MTTGILLLAAGSSRRFGSDKRKALLPNGQTLLSHTVRQALRSGLPVMVCLRGDDTELADQLQNLGASTLLCPVADEGMGSTLAYGVKHLPDWDRLLIALGDMPDIIPATFCKAAAALDTDDICQPCLNGTPGHPVGFSRAYFAQLAKLEGDSGARTVLRKNGEAVIRFPVDDPGIVRDIDRPVDIQ